MSLLQVEQLQVCFDDTSIVQDVSFSIAPGRRCVEPVPVAILPSANAPGLGDGATAATP